MHKRFGRHVALDGVSFAVQPGTVCGFLGPNGAGKTTALRILLGLVRADAGEALLDGTPLAGHDRPALAAGAALQGFGFHPDRTGRSHLRILAARAGIDDADVDGTLERVGLGARGDDRVRGYSEGMRRRLGLAGALLGRPRTLVLDEPANGLDPSGLRWLRDLLRGHADAGGCVLLSSHLLSELAPIADTVVILNRGRVVADGPVASLARPSLRVRGPERDRLAAALERAGAAVRGEGDALHVTGVEADAVGRLALAEQLVLHELAPLRSLEDAYLELLGDDG